MDDESLGLPSGLEEELEGLEDELNTNFEKKVKDKLKKKEENISYRFNYVDFKNKICVNTVVSIDKETGEKHPTFVKWDGEKYEFCQSFKTVDGEVIKIPPINEAFYKDFYDDIVFPDTIIEDLVPTDVIDEKITEFLKAWNIHPEDYYVIARNYIKFTWIYERFYLRPYLLVYGDYGTGKSRWGRYITRLCQNGIIMEQVSAPTLARILQITNATIMLDELDKIDFMKDAEALNNILRNGYQAKGRYRVAEQEGKNFKPSSFLVDQPKIIVKRNMIRDDALASRTIPFKMTPRDKDLKDEMRSNDESWWYEQRNIEMTAILNLLLKWRWQNIFLQDNVLIVPNMMARFNDTLMPLLKMGSLEDKRIMIDYMRKQEKVAIDSASDDYRIQMVKFVHNLVEEERARSLLGTPASRIFITDILAQAKTVLGGDMSEFDFKRAWNPRYIKRALMDLGFEIDKYQNKSCIKAESLMDLMPRLKQKYNIVTDEAPPPEEKLDEVLADVAPVDKLVDKDIDTDIDRNIIKTNKE